jgi:hypothetical protein
MRQRNASPDVFGPVIPFLTFDNRKDKLSQKLVDNALDRIKNFVPPELARANSKHLDDSKKLLSPLKQKKSVDNFKTHLATTGSLARLISKPGKASLGNQELVAEQIGSRLGTHASDPRLFRKPPVNSGLAIGRQTEFHKKIYLINHKHDQTIKQNREVMKASHLKALKNEDSSFGVEARESNSPFYT